MKVKLFVSNEFEEKEHHINIKIAVYWYEFCDDDIYVCGSTRLWVLAKFSELI